MEARSARRVNKAANSRIACMDFNYTTKRIKMRDSQLATLFSPMCGV